MLLVDSSVWIANFNRVVAPQTNYLRSQKARLALGHFPQVPMLNPELAVQSARYYRALRHRGITIRKSIDCFIATYAIAHRHELLHADADFDPFEAHLGLRVIQA